MYFVLVRHGTTITLYYAEVLTTEKKEKVSMSAFLALGKNKLRAFFPEKKLLPKPRDFFYLSRYDVAAIINGAKTKAQVFDEYQSVYAEMYND